MIAVSARLGQCAGHLGGNMEYTHRAGHDAVRQRHRAGLRLPLIHLYQRRIRSPAPELAADKVGVAARIHIHINVIARFAAGDLKYAVGKGDKGVVDAVFRLSDLHADGILFVAVAAGHTSQKITV